MKTQDKILALGLPAAISAVLAEQLSPQAQLCQEGDIGTARPPYDLILTGPENADFTRDALWQKTTPALTLSFKKPLRLGTILRQMTQMLADPVLYLEDMSGGDWDLLPQDKMIRTPGHDDIVLTDKEVEVIVYLARQNGEKVTRDDLLKNVWRYQSGVDTHTLETHIYRLRQKLAVVPALKNLVQTDDDGGYRLTL